MEFNTSTLGYKLISGKLESKRNHSEQLNKFLAGFIDADGSFYMYFSKDRVGMYRSYCFTCIDQAASVDYNHSMMKALRSFYNVGSFRTYTQEERHGKSLMYSWLIASKDTLKLTNLIKKHLLIKGTHLDNLLWLQEELRGVPLTKEQVEDLKPFIKCSRKNSKWIKQPKHPSWAWLAGYLAGDGHFRCRIKRRVWDKRFDRFTYHNQLSVSATSSTDDGFILDFIARHTGGKVGIYSGYTNWTRGLGKSTEKSSLPFLRKLRKYMCLEKKYTIIEQMIKFHENNKSQRLSELGAKA